MKLIIFGVLQFVLWTAFSTTVSLVKGEQAIVILFAVCAMCTLVMLAVIIREKK